MQKTKTIAKCLPNVTSNLKYFQCESSLTYTVWCVDGAVRLLCSCELQAEAPSSGFWLVCPVNSFLISFTEIVGVLEQKLARIQLTFA